jgi:hypothetical protein
VQYRETALRRCVQRADALQRAAAAGVSACKVPPISTIDLGTEYGRWQFVCLCLGGRWHYQPAPVAAVQGGSPDAVRYKEIEKQWQQHFALTEPVRAGNQRGPRFAGRRVRSALTLVVYPVLMQFAEFAYRDACARSGIPLQPSGLPASVEEAGSPGV